MDPRLIYAITLAVIFMLIFYLQMKFGLLRDNSTNAVRPYSFARVQLTWWTFLVLSAIIAIIWASGNIPDLSTSSLVLLGIGTVTTVSARLIDISDDTNAAQTGTQSTLSRNMKGEGFFLDILSDKNGISIHRLQAVAFNFVFGIWFVYKVYQNMGGVHDGTVDVDDVIPVFSQNNLILLGLSAGTYAALKSTENSTGTATPAMAAAQAPLPTPPPAAAAGVQAAPPPAPPAPPASGTMDSSAPPSAS